MADNINRREALEAAFDEHAELATEESPGGADTPAADESATVDRNQPAERVDEEVLEITPTKGRDKAGKFAIADKPVADVVKPAVEVKSVVDTTVKAPVSWKPTAREKWSTVDKEIQAEVLRRDQEIDQTLRQTSEARQYAGRMHQIISPYEAMIRAEGGTAHTAVDNLLKTAYHLRTANPQQKAVMVAQMIKQHSVDVKMLDEALSQIVKGQQPNVASDPMSAYLQRELAPVKQFITEIQNTRQRGNQDAAHEAEQSLAQFKSDPKNEFVNDVMEDMADIMDAHTRRGVKISLSDAYKRATVAHPEISKIIASRQVTASAAQRSAAARRARNASASLPSGGAPAGAAESSSPKTRRSAIEAAWEEAESRES